MLKVRCTRRTTSASASASATTRSPFTRCTTLPLWGLLLTAPAKRAHGNYFNCMHLKARQQKTREAEGVRESGAGWQRESERGGKGKGSETSISRRRRAAVKAPSRGKCSTQSQQQQRSGWGTGGQAFLCHSCCTQVVDAAI